MNCLRFGELELFAPARGIYRSSAWYRRRSPRLSKVALSRLTTPVPLGPLGLTLLVRGKVESAVVQIVLRLCIASCLLSFRRTSRLHRPSINGTAQVTRSLFHLRRRPRSAHQTATAHPRGCSPRPVPPNAVRCVLPCRCGPIRGLLRLRESPAA